MPMKNYREKIFYIIGNTLIRVNNQENIFNRFFFYFDVFYLQSAINR